MLRFYNFEIILAMKALKKLIIKPGKKVRLSDYDPEYTADFKDKEIAENILKENISSLSELQYRLKAENKRSLLIILQGMDTSGKDGTIRNVMSGSNPQDCRVTSFKAPSQEEYDHDFLWRIHKAIPSKGEIGIFNRSHYEDVLAARVHEIVPKSTWSLRYKQINNFEEMLTQNDVVILKFFLYISKDEQKKRLEERLEDPMKNWKLSEEDFKERKYWNDYIEAYQDVLSLCSTKSSPWFVIPANKKWFRNLAVSQIIIETLKGMNVKFPPSTFNFSKFKAHNKKW